MTLFAGRRGGGSVPLTGVITPSWRMPRFLPAPPRRLYSTPTRLGPLAGSARRDGSHPDRCVAPDVTSPGSFAGSTRYGWSVPWPVRSPCPGLCPHPPVAPTSLISPGSTPPPLLPAQCLCSTPTRPSPLAGPARRGWPVLWPVCLARPGACPVTEICTTPPKPLAFCPTDVVI